MPKNTLKFQLKITHGGREGEGEGGGGGGARFRTSDVLSALIFDLGIKENGK